MSEIAPMHGHTIFGALILHKDILVRHIIVTKVAYSYLPWGIICNLVSSTSSIWTSLHFLFYKLCAFHKPKLTLHSWNMNNNLLPFCESLGIFTDAEIATELILYRSLDQWIDWFLNLPPDEPLMKTTSYLFKFSLRNSHEVW